MVKLLSLNHSLNRDGTNTFTLEDIIAARVDEFASCSEVAKVKIAQARRSIEIDEDVVNAMRLRFGNMPLGRALRIMLGLQPKIAQNAWQGEEDMLIREHYPSMGAVPLAKVLDRNPDCVRNRASNLGIKRVWLFKRDRRGRIRAGN